MEELKARVKELMQEIEFTHLKKNWVKHLIEMGIEENDAYKWVAEIGHVVDEYERSLRFLIEVLEETEVVRTVEELDSWIAYTEDMTVWKLGDVTSALEGTYEKYLPPNSDDDEDPDEAPNQ